MDTNKNSIQNGMNDDKQGFIIVESSLPDESKGNSISTTAYVFSIIIAVVGGLAGVIILFNNVITGIAVIVSAFVSWLLFISLSEIIRLLNSIKNSTSRTRQYIVKPTTAYVTNVQGSSGIAQKANICSSLNPDATKAKELFEQGLISEEDYHKILGD